MNICTNVDVPTSIGCTPSANTAAYRIDAYSTPTSRSCELLGPDVVGNGQLGVQALAEADGDEGDGVSTMSVMLPCWRSLCGCN